MSGVLFAYCGYICRRLHGRSELWANPWKSWTLAGQSSAAAMHRQCVTWPINSSAATGAIIVGWALSGCWLIINIHYSVHLTELGDCLRLIGWWLLIVNWDQSLGSCFFFFFFKSYKQKVLVGITLASSTAWSFILSFFLFKENDWKAPKQGREEVFFNAPIWLRDACIIHYDTGERGKQITHCLLFCLPHYFLCSSSRTHSS